MSWGFRLPSRLAQKQSVAVLRYRQKIADGVEYSRDGVDIQHLLQVTNGNWFWYRGGLTVPGCPDWGARWLIFELPDYSGAGRLRHSYRLFVAFYGYLIGQVS